MGAPVISTISKEIAIKIGRVILGDRKVYAALLKRGLQLRGIEKYYTATNKRINPPTKKTLIYMADGKYMHGGITDRIRAMASAFLFAETHGMDFRIFHPSPFPLQQALIPNEVDWTIVENELSYHPDEAKPVLLYRDDFDNDQALELQLQTSHRQYHLYSCIDSAGEKFPELFHRLFKPAPALQQQVDAYREILGNNYCAISFRFQNLLGDYREYTFKSLDEQKKAALISQAVQAFNHLSQDNSAYDKLLVTADSPSFLEIMKKVPRTVTVFGKSLHIDFNPSGKFEDFAKAFVEFLLIAEAKEVYFYSNKNFRTYPSNFPRYAAKLGNIPFRTFGD